MQTLCLFRTRINHTNRYAVVGAMKPLFLLRTCTQSHQRYAVVGAIQLLFLLRTRIQSCQSLRGSWCNTNVIFTPNLHQSCQPLRGSWCYETIALFRTFINHANRYAVVNSTKIPFYSKLAPNHINRYTVVDIIVISYIVDLTKTRGILSPICIIFNKDCLFPKTSKGDAPYGTSPQHESKI